MFLQRGVLEATLRKSYDDILDNSVVSSNHSMGDHWSNSFTHLEHDGIILSNGNGYCYQAFEQDDNANVLNISTDNSKDTSKGPFKR